MRQLQLVQLSDCQSATSAAIATFIANEKFLHRLKFLELLNIIHSYTI